MKKAKVLSVEFANKEEKFVEQKEKASTVDKMLTSHKRYNCPICNEFCSDKGGRVKDIKRLGQPKKSLTAVENVFTKLFDNTLHANLNIEIQNMSKAQMKSFICEIYKDVFSPCIVRTSYYFCSECMTSHFKHKESNLTDCPICHS